MWTCVLTHSLERITIHYYNHVYVMREAWKHTVAFLTAVRFYVLLPEIDL